MNFEEKLASCISTVIISDANGNVEKKVISLDELSFVEVDVFNSMFGAATSYDEMLSIDQQGNYGYSRFIEKWHSKGLI